MDKKKIGASVGILAAVSIGATAYASTFHNSNDNNLADQVSYETQVSSDTYRKYDNLAKKTAKKSKYTKDVKGTKVGGEKREKKYEVKEVEQTPAVTTSYEQPTIEYVDQTDYDEDQEVADVEDNTENEVSNDIVTLYVNVDLLNVRNTPDLTDDSNIIDVLKHGDKVTGYLQDGWLVTEDGNYIYADFLTSDKLEYEEIEVEDNSEDYVGWVNVDQLIVRDRPSEDGEYIDVFEQGTKVEGLLKDGWVEFDYYGQKAYVNQSYLSDTEVLTKLEEEKLEKEEAEKKAQEEAEK
ncbi:MAG: hypothetical protein Q4B52_02195, partial [Tissierellia bacterium]|nr:hypothetical protein [Tissierellia bacterium]